MELGGQGVESQLASLGAQKKKQERAVMLLQRESKKCEDLQEGLGQLKRQKVRCPRGFPFVSACFCGAVLHLSLIHI